jgi:nucleoside-diphosphate-sugar epimerase
MAARVLLTGASGFIGRHAVGALLERGFEVHAVTSTAPPPGTSSDVQWHRVDLLDAAASRALLAQVGPSHLLHLAWNVEHGVFWASPENERWLAASVALLEAFEGERAVAAGTCAEYDWEGEGTLEERTSPLGPATVYGLAKDALRRRGERLASERGSSFAWGRIFFLHGPGEHPQRLVPSVTLALLAGEPARCTDGRQVRDFLHSADAARAFVALLDSPVAGAVNVASGIGVAVAEMVTWIGELLGRPELIELGALPSRPGDPQALVGAVERLREEVGFTPAWAPREALAQSVQWWVSQEGGRASRPGGA